MALHFVLRQSKFKDEKSQGKWYAQTVRQGELTMREIEEQIQQSCSVTKADVRAVLAALQEVVGRGLKDGLTVNLDEMGKLYLSIRSECVDNPDDFRVQKHVKGVACKYVPASRRISQQDRRLTRPFTSDCQLTQDSLYDESGHMAKRIRRSAKV